MRNTTRRLPPSGSPGHGTDINLCVFYSNPYRPQSLQDGALRAAFAGPNLIPPRQMSTLHTVLFSFSELREGDRYPKVNTPLGCDRRILVIRHPL